ncbi:TPR repeat-containing protein [Cryptosporidium ubiquitum]|uniref:TPR repeat-containing protein n=1 Tax=Cryptosporidium ubiquitum TaxID=857276 RepID=A0A1J4MIT7_9CRYT|nr:TPR repeat-containing protein [Cryptosporidium ubiquitum]OII74136.1 TPR repeat-containing protein [Cryptosporidium ubiquitum]
MKTLELLSKAQALINKFPPEYENANILFTQAVKLDPLNSNILSAYGEFMCSIGNFDRAKELLEKSIKINPYDDYVKYFSLAQILDGEESLFYWRKGIEILRENIKNIMEKRENDKYSIEKLDLMRDQLCSAYCAISELFMTDLCYNNEAESQVRENLAKASEINEDHFETLCCKLSYFKTIDDFEECKLYVSKIKRILENKYNLCVEFKDLVDEYKDNEVLLPEYSVRLNLSRTLIDLNETELAELVLSTLLKEDEEDWQVWYLLSWCSLVSEDVNGAVECFKLFEKYGNKHIQDTELKQQFMSDIDNLKLNIEKIKTSK